MAQDIFVPESDPQDAVVGPLHTVTYVTADKEAVGEIFQKGYGLTEGDWRSPAGSELAQLNEYLGFPAGASWQSCVYQKAGTGGNAQIRVIAVDSSMPLVRPSYDGLYTGGATISFPINDLRAHEKIMQSLGVESTMGVKELEFTAPTGETYVSAEIVYKGPDNIFVMGVTRPEIFVPVGPIDSATGMGGLAYSARCTDSTDASLDFLQAVMGYEVRRDVGFVVGEQSAINLPEGTEERFIQAFACGASSGYLVLMDHGAANKRGAAPSYGPPNRGIAMWSFATQDIAEVHRRAVEFGAEVVSAPGDVPSPFLGCQQVMLLRDPDGFLYEIFEA